MELMRYYASISGSTNKAAVSNMIERKIAEGVLVRVHSIEGELFRLAAPAGWGPTRQPG